MSTDKNQLVAIGVSLGRPVILMVDKQNGQATRIITGKSKDTVQPTVKTFSALHFDNTHWLEPPTVFFSYTEADRLQLSSIRIEQTITNPNWHFEFEELSVID